MPVTGDQPAHGLRLVLSRPHEGGPPWAYAGEALTADARYPAAATVNGDGTVTVTLEGATDPALTKKAELILRTAFKNAQEDPAVPSPPPRRVVRWRGEK